MKKKKLKYGCIGLMTCLCSSVQAQVDSIVNTEHYYYDARTGNLNYTVSNSYAEGWYGHERYTQTIYPLDLEQAGIGFVQNMIDRRILHLPIEQVSNALEIGNPVDNVVTGATAIRYAANGYTPEEVYVLDNPVSDFGGNTIALNQGNVDPADFFISPRYRKQLQVDSMDGRGNVLQSTSIDGITSANIYGYGNRLKFAEVIDAEYKDIAYTSFETIDGGGWEYPLESTGTWNYFTGRRFYDLYNGNIYKSNMDTAMTYTLTLWYDTIYGPPTVQADMGASIAHKKGRLITNDNVDREWQLMHYTISGTSSVALSGNAHIDELRLHPLDAQMTTYCYEYPYGVSSANDHRNMAMHYVYDDLGRISRVIDHNYNLYQVNEYHLQNTPEP